MIADPAIRVVTLTGVAGVGKSCLAAAALCAAGANHATAAVDFGEVDGGLAARRMIREALDAPNAELRSAAAASPSERAILLLDNCDRVADDIAGFVAELLQARPELSVLATGRRALDLYRECVVDIPALPCVPPAEGGLSDAARLLLNGVEARQGHTETAPEAATLEAIATALGGVPAALEMAATTVVRIGPKRTLERIVSGLPLLPSPYVDIPLRHRTIRACVEWSTADLDDSAVELLLHIAVSDVLTDLDELLLFLRGELSDLVEQRLHTLVRHSLLDLSVCADGRYTYAMSGLIRVYCRQLLQQDPARWARVRRSQVCVLRKLASEMGRMLELPGRRPAVRAAVDRWLPDLIGTVHHLIGDGRPEGALDMLADLEDVWIERGLLSEAEAIVASILDEEECAELTAARCRAVLGRWALRSGRFHTAVDLLAEAARAAHPNREPALGVRVVRQLGEAYRETGNGDQAREQLGRAARWQCTTQERSAIDLAAAVVEVGETPPGTEDGWSNLRECAAGLHDRRDRLFLLGGLGRALVRARAPHRALEVFHSVLSTADPVVDLLEIVAALEGCAHAYRVAGVDHAEYCDRLSAAAQRIRETRALPRAEEQVPRLVVGDDMSVVSPEDRFAAPTAAADCLDQAVAYALAAPPLTDVDIDSPVSRLTKRQLEIAHLVAQGLTNRMIATRLGIAEWTVINHLRKVMAKLDCPSRIHVALVIERGPQRSA
ncbi:LuxR C-terminal-related transcriptional regulator [Nocardia takedensis]